MLDISFYLINGFAEFYILFRYFGAFLGEKRLTLRLIAPITLLLLVGYVRVNLLRIPVANLIAYTVVMAVISAFFSGNALKKVLYILAMTVANLAVDLFLLQLFVMLGHDLEANFYLHGFTSTIVRMILIHIIILRRQPKEWEYDRSILVIVSVVWGMVVLYALLFMPNLFSAEPGTFRWFFLDAMLMLMSLLIFVLFEISTNKKIAEKRAYEVELQMESQKKYYEQFQHYEKEIRSYKHDMKHFLLGLLNESDERKEQQIQKRLHMIDAASSTLYTENELIQLLVQNLVARVDIPDGKLEIQCRVPKEMGFENTELSVLLGNHFDNIAEALNQLPRENRRLQLQIDFTPLRLRIFTINTFMPQAAKKPQKNRGVGTKSMRRIVERHSGHFATSATDHDYTTEITLPLS